MGGQDVIKCVIREGKVLAMKRFIAVLSGLLVMPAFAEVAPVYYDEVTEFSDVEMFDGDVVYDDEVVVQDEEKSVAAPKVSGRTTIKTPTRATRTVPAVAATGSTTRASATAPSRAVASRATANISQTRNAMTRGTASRAATTRSASSQKVTTRRGTVAANSGTAARSGTTSIVQTDTVNTPLYTGRVGMRTTTGSAVSARVPAVRVANSTSAVTSTVSVEDVTTSMDELAQITDFCKAQYTECMDNFCNTLDDAQGRCSCSKNIKNYAKTENALKEATETLQDVAQKIQYIGLTSSEIETLFAQTEAEAVLQGSSDSSQMKSSLDKIKNMIVDVKSGTASSGEVSGVSLNLDGLLDFSFDSAGIDINAIFGNTTTNTASISNQRGEELYKTAAARCKSAVLSDCAAQGVDTAVITNAYDLEIDKQCLVYERSLTESNDQMKATVRNAQAVLQKARLMVAQQKNSYDLRGCVNALDSCMQDDFVCGTDYEGCLDPTGKFIVDGKIVVGSEPGDETGGLSSVWDDAWGENGLSSYISTTAKAFTGDESADNNIVKFLMKKIGYHDEDGKNNGMCISVLNKCQNYTYDNGNYVMDNVVVKEYLQRTLTQIKAAQDEMITNYAENCITDVQSCLNQNGYGNDGVISDVAINSCRASIKSCMSVNGDKTDGFVGDMKIWIANMLKKSISGVEICSAGQVYVFEQNMMSGACKNIAVACSTFNKNEAWYNAAEYRCEKLNGSASSGKCTLTGLESQTFNASTNTCSCPEGKVFVKYTGTADKMHGIGNCCTSGQTVDENGSCVTPSAN